MGANGGRHRKLVRELLRSPEPSIRWRTRVRVLGEPDSTPSVQELAQKVRRSRRTAALLSILSVPRREATHSGIYRYYQGIHWALTSLADLGYPAADPLLQPAMARALGMWTETQYDRTVRVTERTLPRVREGVPLLNGRYRRCASQQGNALLYCSTLGGPTKDAEHLATLLGKWQWPDGGWNCARSAKAQVSSFMESLAPMRGLAAYAARSGSKEAQRVAGRAAELFLSRRLFRRRSNGRVMRPSFLELHYPLYWHYDVLGGLKGMADVGRLGDPRCGEALDWLEARELPSGGWPADARFYSYSPEYRYGCEFTDWGAPNRRARNDWITTDALYVLRAAGRWDV